MTESTIWRFLTILVMALLLHKPEVLAFSYLDPFGPANWSTLYPVFCNGTNQSPINIIKNSTVYSASLQSSIESLSFSNMSATSQNMWLLYNDGNTAHITVTNTMYFSGLGLPWTYKVNNIHMHWANSSTIGSEHELNGQSYAMEIHIVGVNSSFSSVAAAMNSNMSGAVAVLGVFVEIGAKNQVLEGVISNLSDIIWPNEQEMNVSAFNISALMPPNDACGRANYFRYSGSLTTPMCNEIVTWTVFENPISMSEDQINDFRMLYFNAPASLNKNFTITSNHRPVQPLNGRVVMRSYNQDASLSCSTTTQATTAGTTQPSNSSSSSSTNATTVPMVAETLATTRATSASGKVGAEGVALILNVGALLLSFLVLGYAVK